MNPAALLALLSGQPKNFLAAALPGGIEAQEKQGQIEQSFAETLPVDGTIKKRHGDGDDRAQWEAFGFTFGNVEDIFVNVTFPAGWKKQVTGHSMWTDIVDDKGRKRGGIFYKAAFYDRHAHCYLTPRFSYTAYRDGSVKGKYSAAVMDCDTPHKEFGEYDSNDRARCDELEAEMKAWLDSNYPDYKEISKYWD